MARSTRARRAALAPAALAALAAALGVSACGYGFSQRYVAKGGAERVHVRPFENLSTQPQLGGIVTAALRTALARRGADGGEGAPVSIEGEVHASEPVPASQFTPRTGAPLEVGTWTVALEVRARLVAGEQRLAELTWRRETIYLGGSPVALEGGRPDTLETEGRRALALRRLADQAAPEILRAFER